MKTAVITFPGSNCEDDAFDTLGRVCGFESRRIWHKDRADFSSTDLVVLPGGFSYGDYLRCGAIAALSPVIEDVKAFAAQGGRVIGICNGFQILCESGLLPGALTMNANRKFVCKDVPLRTTAARAPWTTLYAKDETVSFPIAHGDGRYWIDDTGLADLRAKNQILFTYVENPNGSVADIAGICNEAGNVFGLMPHPERASELRSRHGMKLWKSISENLGATRGGQ